MKLLFLTTANLTTNPRLLKEIIFLKDKILDIKVIAFRQGNWSDDLDNELLKKHPIDIVYLSATRKPFLSWLQSTLILWFSIKAYSIANTRYRINAYGHNKRSFLIKKTLKNLKYKPDLIIAHNLGALYPAWWLSKKHNIPFAFDVEDYHPGEKVAKDAFNEKQRREFLMKKLLPDAKFVLFAAPLIMKETLKLVGKTKVKNPTLINNSFFANEFDTPRILEISKEEEIKLVWFSQNIAMGRGLENLLPAIKKFKYQVSLYLIGNLYQDFYDEVLSKYDNIYIIPPLSQKDLHKKLSEFDVGLALELNSADYNRQICLTNKIWAYYQAGLYIIATDTPAQVEFMRQKSNHGILSGQSINDIENAITNVIENKDLIHREKVRRFGAAQSESWDYEGKKLEEILKKVITSN